MPTLVVIRHAKADRPPGVEDFDRPLLPRGRRDALAAGQWLRDHVDRPGLIVSSPARRATETVDGLLSAYPDDASPPLVVDEQLFDASLGDTLHVVRGLDDDEGTIAIVGHDPSFSDLVSELTGRPTELKTCGIAVIGVPSTWADTPPGGCQLLTLETPRG